MREIKFRGKRVDNGEWVVGSLMFYFIHEKELNPSIQVLKNGVYYGSFKVIPETVGQFIGLKDNNGKEIYEWDKIHAWGGTEYQGMFEYDYYGVCKFSNGEFCIDTNIISISFGNMDEVEVIDNNNEPLINA